MSRRWSSTAATTVKATRWTASSRVAWGSVGHARDAQGAAPCFLDRHTDRCRYRARVGAGQPALQLRVRHCWGHYPKERTAGELLSLGELSRSARKSSQVRWPTARSGARLAPARNARAAPPGTRTGRIGRCRCVARR
jgi:hypothetical protein